MTGADRQIDIHRLVIVVVRWGGDDVFGNFSHSFDGRKGRLVVVVAGALRRRILVVVVLAALQQRVVFGGRPRLE